jgi:hypothetical protein
MAITFIEPKTLAILEVPDGKTRTGRNVTRYVGERNIPQDVKRRRHSVYDAMRRFGAPTLIKHRYNADDVDEGIAEKSPNFDDVYGQTRRDDPLSYGVGFVSVEKSENEWVSPYGELVVADDIPTSEYVPAPKYRGYGPGHLTYIIEPDIAEDAFKVVEGGALIKVQQATAQAPWYPEINDNDLLINVILGRGWHIESTLERYVAKMTTPISMRGLDRRGRREYTEEGGNRFVVNQTFQMVLLPENDVLGRIEVDR